MFNFAGYFLFLSMKTFAFFLILSFAWHLETIAQNTSNADLEARAASASGTDKVALYIQLSDAYVAAGQLEKAENAAGKAEDAAQKIGRNDLRAIAYNRIGKIYFKKDKRGVFGGDKAGGKFRESIKLAGNDRALLIDNWENLRAIALRRSNKKLQEEAEAKLAQLTGSPVPSGGSNASNTPPAPSSPPATLPLTNKEKELLKKSGELESLLSAREAQIGQMSEEQMKFELMIMQQRQLLDSMSYRAKVDSLSAYNATLQLSEAKRTREFYLAALAALILLAGGSTFSFIRAQMNARILEEKNKIIRSEQERSENLLLNILPSLIAEELKQRGRTEARFFEDVGVLFADFVNFSAIAEQLEPRELVRELDTCFQAFDQIIVKHGLEKIKTIGDAYMAAGGLPHGGGSQLREMVNAAREMQQWLAIWNVTQEMEGKPRFEARIGIHRGPVVAGVVGSKKFAFDIWGDTVNIAARIEAASEGGRINISGDAYQIIKDYFPCQYRGKIPAKNKGEIDMYFVEN